MTWYPASDAYQRGMRHGRVGLVTDDQECRRLYRDCRERMARTAAAYYLGALRGIRDRHA